MRIVIAGGTGFLGHALSRHLIGARHEVVILSRESGGASKDAVPDTRVVAWTPNGDTGPWAAEIDVANVVVNVAGAGLADRRWTAERKRVLRDSRVLSTRSLAAALARARRKPAVFIQTAGVGIYGAFEDGRLTLDEDSPPGTDFLAELCVEWEAEAAPIAAVVRTVIFRNGVVLARHGGALARMLPPFYFFAGGPVASGRQYMSWITLHDWVRMVEWAIENSGVTGAINVTAPGPVPNREFARAIGRALHRPSWAPVPGFVLRMMFGEMAQNVLILGQRVLPRRAMSMGFRFEDPEIEPAMTRVLQAGSGPV